MTTDYQPSGIRVYVVLQNLPGYLPQDDEPFRLAVHVGDGNEENQRLDAHTLAEAMAEMIRNSAEFEIEGIEHDPALVEKYSDIAQSYDEKEDGHAFAELLNQVYEGIRSGRKALASEYIVWPSNGLVYSIVGMERGDVEELMRGEDRYDEPVATGMSAPAIWTYSAVAVPAHGDRYWAEDK